MIEQKYLLVIMIPCYLDQTGARLVDELWHKDLLKHLDHIADLALASPVREEPPPEGRYLAIVPRPGQGSIRFLDLPSCRSTPSALLGIPAAAIRLWKAMDEAEVVHVNAGGWPISYGWLAAPMAKIRGKFVLANIESAGWRLWLRRPWRPVWVARGLLFEAMARLCVNLSDLATFTHAGYRDELLHESRKGRGHVVQASWIDEEVILSDEEANALWDKKLADPSRPPRVVFAASLTESKGAHVFLEALELLDRRGTNLDVRVYGKGVFLEAFEKASARLKSPLALTLEGTMAYGPEFFAMLRTMDVLVVPSTSDEQPRIVYDAFSQALPVIASDTPGLRQCVSDGRNGVMVAPRDPAALADAIEKTAAARSRLREFGLAGLDTARSLTHGRMHARRAELLRESLASRA